MVWIDFKINSRYLLLHYNIFFQQFLKNFIVMSLNHNKKIVIFDLSILNEQKDIYMKKKRITNLFKIMKSPLLAIIFGGFLWTFSSPSYADLRVCNKTQNPINIALGYKAPRGWQSEGWWLAASNECAIVYTGDLNARYFYLFAADDIGGGSWDGKVFMCTRDESFTIFGVEDCLARGYERSGFFEVDTQNKADWTIELTEKNITEKPENIIEKPENITEK